MPDETQSPTRIRHAVTAWLAVGAVLAYLCRNSLGVAESNLREQLGLSEQQMGFILGPAFFWTYALAQIPTGWLGERFGSRRCIPLFALIWSLATAAIYVGYGFSLLVASRVANGVGQAGLFPCSTRTISLWHPQASRASASGILGAAMSLGGALGAGLTGLMLGFMPARTIFALFALPGIVWAIAFWFWFRERPEDHQQVNASEVVLIVQGRNQLRSTNNCNSGTSMWLGLLSSPATWLICGQQFFRAGGYAFFASWFATYLVNSKGVSLAQSGMLTMLPLAATVAGSTLGGACSDAIFRATRSLALARKGVSSVSLLVCAALVLAAYFVKQPVAAVSVISLGAFLAAFAGPCSYAVTMDMGDKHVASLFSTMNMIGNFGAGLLPLLVPSFKQWIESSPELLSSCGGNSWNAVLLLFAVTYLGSALCWLFLNTHGTVFDQSLIRGKPPSDEVC